MKNLLKNHYKINRPINRDAYLNTINALKNNKLIIYQGVLYNEENKTYGCPDIIIKGSKLNELFDQNEDKNKYYIIDIKFSTIKLSADKTYILNNDMIPYYKSQILLYTQALNKILNQDVKKGFILGKKYISESRKIKYVKFNNKYNILGTVNFETNDNNYLNILNDAIEWVLKLRSEGSTWKIIPKPTINELFPNMSNHKDGKWRQLKNEIALNIKELTLLVNVGINQRQNAFNNDVYSFDNPNCNSNILGLNNNRGKQVDTIIKVNTCNKIIIPDKINYSVLNWRKTPKNIMEFYLDYETTLIYSNFEENIFIFMIGVGYVNKNNKWIFKCFVVKNSSLESQKEMFDEFWIYINNILIQNKKDDSIFIHWTHAEQSFYNKIKDIINIQDKNYLDLHQVFVNEPIAIKGAFNYSLKSIAKAMYNNNLINTSWNNLNTCNNGLDAMIYASKIYENKRDEKIKSGRLNLKKFDVLIKDVNDIAEYNEIDCRVLYDILKYLRINH